MISESCQVKAAWSGRGTGAADDDDDFDKLLRTEGDGDWRCSFGFGRRVERKSFTEGEDDGGGGVACIPSPGKAMCWGVSAISCTGCGGGLSSPSCEIWLPPLCGMYDPCSEKSSLCFAFFVATAPASPLPKSIMGRPKPLLFIWRSSNWLATLERGLSEPGSTAAASNAPGALWGSVLAECTSMGSGLAEPGKAEVLRRGAKGCVGSEGPRLRFGETVICGGGWARLAKLVCNRGGGSGSRIWSELGCEVSGAGRSRGTGGGGAV